MELKLIFFLEIEILCFVVGVEVAYYKVSEYEEKLNVFEYILSLDYRRNIETQIWLRL